MLRSEFPVRLIALYLPQFHPIAENDEWWGKGFTEWTNVVKAKPLFRGHYQPHLPSDFGFYDLRLPEVRESQADLAREYGIYGFCYYHYWFNGRRVLDRPFKEVLASGQPDFPFCLCWANENWTRLWDGRKDHVLLKQEYSHEDDLRHIESLIPALRDERYIRIGNKPLLLIYRTELLPNPARTAAIWRESAKWHGVGDLYLARVESYRSDIDPKTIGFDAAVEFAPDWQTIWAHTNSNYLAGYIGKVNAFRRQYRVFEYSALAEAMQQKNEPHFTWFRAITPSWDNSSRRKQHPVIFHRSTPEIYESWLRSLIAFTAKRNNPDERVIFINAWNEWAEGNHLEPDQRWGHLYLKATHRALNQASSKTHVVETAMETGQQMAER
jgi:lipopolysaccharide biosynthesis protein